MKIAATKKVKMLAVYVGIRWSPMTSIQPAMNATPKHPPRPSLPLIEYRSMYRIAALNALYVHADLDKLSPIFQGHGRLEPA